MFLGAEAIRAEGRRSRTSRHDIKENGTIVVLAPTFPIGEELGRGPTCPKAIAIYALCPALLSLQTPTGTAAAVAVVCVMIDRHADKKNPPCRTEKVNENGTQNPSMPIRWVKSEKQIRAKKQIFSFFSFSIGKCKVSFQRKGETAAPWPGCLLGFVVELRVRPYSRTTAVSRKVCFGFAKGMRSSFSARFFHSVEVFIAEPGGFGKIWWRACRKCIVQPGTWHPPRCRERVSQN